MYVLVLDCGCLITLKVDHNCHAAVRTRYFSFSCPSFLHVISIEAGIRVCVLENEKIKCLS